MKRRYFFPPSGSGSVRRMADERLHSTAGRWWQSTSKWIRQRGTLSTLHAARRNCLSWRWLFTVAFIGEARLLINSWMIILNFVLSMACFFHQTHPSHYRHAWPELGGWQVGYRLCSSHGWLRLPRRPGASYDRWGINVITLSDSLTLIDRSFVSLICPLHCPLHCLIDWPLSEGEWLADWLTDWFSFVICRGLGGLRRVCGDSDKRLGRSSKCQSRETKGKEIQASPRQLEIVGQVNNNNLHFFI